MGAELTEVAVSESLTPLFPFLTRTLQRGCDIATTFFAVQGAPVDSALASYIVRWYFLLALRRRIPALGVEHVEDLGLSGISFVAPPYHLRIWKADEAHVAGLATSSTKQAFFAQQMTFDWVRASSIALNLAVLWDVDAQWRLRSLCVGPPEVAHERFGLAWQFAIPIDASEAPS